MPYVLALDQGTTSSRAILFDQAGAIAAVAQHEFQQFYPQAGWVEHDPMEILSSQMTCAVEALAKADARPRDVAAIGITNQRETVIVWDRATGKPIHPAIVWQDRRTAAFCKELEDRGLGEVVSSSTGLVLDPYFSATKVKWILDHVDGARARAERGELAFGTVDSWLIWHLTSGHCHVTDVTNASRTLLYNIVKGEWDAEMLRLFDIPASLLPKVVWSSQRVGEVTTTLGLGGIAIAGIAGDQQAALFGQLCWSAGEAKNTYGTGCFLLQNIGTGFTRSKHRLITTIAASAERRLEYALEGSIFIGGAVVQWLRDNLKLIGSSAEVEALAASVPDAGGVVFVPAFVGLGAPHWDAHAAGMMIGLRRDTSARPHCPRRAGGHCLPGGRRARSRAQRNRVAAQCPARRWRRSGERSAHAVSGRHSRRPRRPAAGYGDNRPGRSLSCGSRHRLLGQLPAICAPSAAEIPDLSPGWTRIRAASSARTGSERWAGQRAGRHNAVNPGRLPCG